MDCACHPEALQFLKNSQIHNAAMLAKCLPHNGEGIVIVIIWVPLNSRLILVFAIVGELLRPTSPGRPKRWRWCLEVWVIQSPDVVLEFPGGDVTASDHCLA